jgi:adenylate kinase
MSRIVTIVTGPIVGLNSTEFLDKTIDFAQPLGIKIKAYNLFDEIIELAGINIEDDLQGAEYIGDLINGYEYQFKIQRDMAYFSIASKISRLPKDTHVIIRTPACIEWRGVSYVLKDHKIIAALINPDRIVTLIDAEWKIQKRLKSGYHKRNLGIIAHQKSLTVEKILQWLGAEVNTSEDWAEWVSYLRGKKVKHLVLGLSAPLKSNRKKYAPDIENMTKIASQKNLISFYASYSMTVATEPVRKIINENIWKLREYGVVIDPASIEIGANINKDDESVVFAYTVCRDLRWDVQKVDIIAAFHPYTKMPPLSTGMMDELGHARAFRKERYMVLPSGGGSPFTRDNYVPSQHIFKSGADFFKCIETKRKLKLKPRFKKITQAFAKWQKQNQI